ncbi:MAG: hypothetical protein H7293_07060 [Candidatus Saccharibacteria bacterium]|nr:hypothetical protein [Rhodoferax sp.]
MPWIVAPAAGSLINPVRAPRSAPARQPLRKADNCATHSAEEPLSTFAPGATRAQLSAKAPAVMLGVCANEAPAKSTAAHNSPVFIFALLSFEIYHGVYQKYFGALFHAPEEIFSNDARLHTVLSERCVYSYVNFNFLL